MSIYANKENNANGDKLFLKNAKNEGYYIEIFIQVNINPREKALADLEKYGKILEKMTVKNEKLKFSEDS